MNAPKHIVGLSGGKDSTATALHLVEAEPRDYEFICNRTGDELPEMVEHWARLESLLGQPIKYVTHSTDLNGLIEELQMLPNFRARWCTRILKIEPTIAYFETLPPGSVLHVGLRADEPLREGLYGEDIKVDFPLRRWGWGIRQVQAYLELRGVKIPQRTDCARCPYQRLGEWRNLWRDYPSLYAEAVEQEHATGHTFRTPHPNDETKSGRDAWPARLDLLSGEFAKGRRIRGDGNVAERCPVCAK